MAAAEGRVSRQRRYIGVHGASFRPPVRTKSDRCNLPTAVSFPNRASRTRAPGRRWHHGAVPDVAIEVRGLRKTYADFEAVRGIDFVVPRGEVFGLLGPNGAGK